jgi:hypothetical protein
MLETNRQLIIPQVQALLPIYVDKNSIVAHALIIQYFRNRNKRNRRAFDNLRSTSFVQRVSRMLPFLLLSIITSHYILASSSSSRL